LLCPLGAYKLTIIKIGASVGELAEDLDYLEYLDLEKDHNDTLMKIGRDQFGRFVTETEKETTKQVNFSSVGMKEGWYQDSKGSLYRYDGIIWDAIPEAPLTTLEYLG
jgi:hypothetical protein